MAHAVAQRLPGTPLSKNIRAQSVHRSIRPYIRIEPAYADYARQSFTPRRPLLEAVVELTGRIHDDFAYDPLRHNDRHPAGGSFRETARRLSGFFAHLRDRLPAFAWACPRGM